MEKSRIFIASSARTLTLGEELRGKLDTEFCEARLWTDADRGQTAGRTLGILQRSADEADFAVIVLARADLIGEGGGDAQKARDNCLFEAGLLIAALSPKRCFLVSSVEPTDLPSNFAEISSMRFDEPSDLSDRKACAEALAGVDEALKASVQTEGRSAYHARVPMLSVDEYFRRERPVFDGGDLQEGEVVVCDLQPMAGVELALQVRRNMDCGTDYHYFLHSSNDTIERLCLSLQVMLVGGAGAAEIATDFNARLSTIKSQRDSVLEDLRGICNRGCLRITLVADEPQFCFRVLNASNPTLARVYVKYFNRGFIPWAEGPGAVSLWHNLPKYLAEDKSDRLLIPLKYFALQGDEKKQFERSLGHALRRYFPGIEDEVRRIFVGDA